MTTTIEVAILLLLILANGLFAMAEMSLVSSRKARLQEKADDGDKGAQSALGLLANSSHFLSTVQVCITLISILSGAVGGATLGERLGEAMNRIAYIAPYGKPLGFGIVVLAITYVSLVIGELLPKSIALNNSERIAAVLAPPMVVVSRLISPFASFLAHSTQSLFRMLGLKPSAEPPVTEEEVRMMIEQGTQVGIFEPTEQEMVNRVFRLSDRDVNSLMTPRSEIIWLDAEDSTNENYQKIMDSPHSRFPVSEGRLDNVLGLAHARDLLSSSVTGEALDIRSVVHPALFLPEGIPAFKILERFKEAHSQIGLVVDEYGSIQGLVTINDILEAIVGDIPQGSEPVDSDAVLREDGSWLFDGRLSVDDFKDRLALEEDLPNEQEGYFQTIGGFVTSTLGRIPVTGDHFEWNGIRFEVVDMDARRVDKVLVIPPQVAASASDKK